MTADDWQARALTAEADMARLREALRAEYALSTKDGGCICAGCEEMGPDFVSIVHKFCVFTPTSPAAVAALVRAARALYEKAKGWPHSEGAHAWCPPSSPPCARCDTLSTLEPLLDAPPWRHIR